MRTCPRAVPIQMYSRNGPKWWALKLHSLLDSTKNCLSYGTILIFLLLPLNSCSSSGPASSDCLLVRIRSLIKTRCPLWLFPHGVCMHIRILILFLVM